IDRDDLALTKPPPSGNIFGIDCHKGHQPAHTLASSVISGHLTISTDRPRIYIDSDPAIGPAFFLGKMECESEKPDTDKKSRSLEKL
ncbi:hypothetical protein BaRGS_00038913, partial [Batillaria attramentaria]